jgi:hypothetical protein
LRLLILESSTNVEERVGCFLTFIFTAPKTLAHDGLFSLFRCLEVVEPPPFVARLVEDEGIIMTTLCVSVVN